MKDEIDFSLYKQNYAFIPLKITSLYKWFTLQSRNSSYNCGDEKTLAAILYYQQIVLTAQLFQWPKEW